jgi:hypothetical protein
MSSKTLSEISALPMEYRHKGVKRARDRRNGVDGILPEI